MAMNQQQIQRPEWPLPLSSWVEMLIYYMKRNALISFLDQKWTHAFNNLGSYELENLDLNGRPHHFKKRLSDEFSNVLNIQ